MYFMQFLHQSPTMLQDTNLQKLPDIEYYADVACTVDTAL